MSYQITGTIHTLTERVAKTEKFTVRTVVLETYSDYDNNRQYPQYVELQAANANCDHLDPFAEGDEVTITFDIRGRSWQRTHHDEIKYFNSLNLYRCEAASHATPTARAAAPAKPRAAAPKAPAKPVRVSLDAQTDSDDFVKSFPADDMPF